MSQKFATLLPQSGDGIRILEAKILTVLNNGGGGGGSGSAQLVTYTVAPPANPTNTAAAAIAYDPTGALPLLGWNVGTQTWN